MIKGLLLISLCLVDFCESRQSKYRRHRNLYSKIKAQDIQKIIQFEPFFMLLVGKDHEGVFEKYKTAMHDIAIQHTIKKSWLHFGFISANKSPEVELLYDLKRLPVLLQFYEGELVKKDYRFNHNVQGFMDLEIKFLHSIGNILPSEAEFQDELDQNLYTLFIHAHPDEELHFDLTDVEKSKFFYKISETISTMPKDEYNVVGIDFLKGSAKQKEFFDKLKVKPNQSCLYLFNKENEQIHELCQEQALKMDQTQIKNWFFHYSHALLLSPAKIHQTLIKNKNYALVFFHGSNQNEGKEMIRKGLQHLESVADKYKGQMSFGVCDVDIEKECQSIVHHFELEDHKFPFVRVLYGMAGQGSQY